MTRKKDRGIPGNPGEFASPEHGEAEGVILHDSVAVEVSIARDYGERTLHALHEILRLARDGSRLASRGHDWYVSDPDNVPGLAAESLVVKIGENVSRVSAEFEAARPEVPWRVIKEMRNRLTHYYEATDYEVIWNTIENDLPQIVDTMLRILGRVRD